jgi:hypothetical protein
MSVGFGFGANNQNLAKDFFAKMLNSQKATSDSVEYVEDLVEFLKDFIKMYDETQERGNMKKTIEYGIFGSILAEDLQTAMKQAKKIIKADKKLAAAAAVPSMGMVNAPKSPKANAPKSPKANADLDDLIAAFDKL